MIKLAGRVLSIVVLAVLATPTTPVQGEDDFPLVGTYTENQACKTDGSDPGVSRVKITPRDIDSVFGLRTILNKKREGATFVVHVECKGPGGSQMLGDVIFTPREDKTIDFSDQDAARTLIVSAAGISGGFPEICATFQRDNLRRRF